MKQIAPLLVMGVGLGIAASFGARNGPELTAYRAALADTSEDKVMAVLPGPEERLRSWAAVAGLPWLFGVGLIAGGAGWARVIAGQDAKDGVGGVVDFIAVVNSAKDQVEKLIPVLEEMPMEGDCPEVRDEIDRIYLELLAPMVEARGQLIAKHGLARFAEYFGPYSGGERNLNRCWSAITDGHQVEAMASIKRAITAFEEAIASYIDVEMSLSEAA